MTRTKKTNGFTLIELMVSVGIVGILVSIAYPSYQSNIQKSHRADAQAALMNLVNFMERRLTEFNRYDELDPSVQNQQTDYYLITINANQFDYSIVAAPKPGTGQVNDSCGILIIDNIGNKRADTTGCW